MKTDEYWIGRGVDYEAVWRAYREGVGYIDKFLSMKVHILRVEFEQYPSTMPLFNHEAIYKTVKGYYHDLKKECLSRDAYNIAGPLFLYSVERGSGIWNFLGELRQLLMLGTTLADERVMGEKLDNMDKRLSFLRRHFGDAVTPEDFQAFMRAHTPRQLEKAVREIIEQGIRSVQISQAPFRGEIESIEETMVELKQLAPGSEGDKIP